MKTIPQEAPCRKIPNPPQLPDVSWSYWNNESDSRSFKNGKLKVDKGIGDAYHLTNERTNEWLKKWVNEWFCGGVKEGNDGVKEGVKEGMKEGMDECIKKASEMVVALNLAYVFEYTSDIDLREEL